MRFYHGEGSKLSKIFFISDMNERESSRNPIRNQNEMHKRINLINPKFHMLFSLVLFSLSYFLLQCITIQQDQHKYHGICFSKYNSRKLAEGEENIPLIKSSDSALIDEEGYDADDEISVIEVSEEENKVYCTCIPCFRTRENSTTSYESMKIQLKTEFSFHWNIMIERIKKHEKEKIENKCDFTKWKNQWGEKRWRTIWIKTWEAEWVKWKNKWNDKEDFMRKAECYWETKVWFFWVRL